jgi:hypothetical protein
MRTTSRINRTTATTVFLVGLMMATPARAQTRTGGADVCVTVDEAHDTFSPQDRTAAVLLMAKQFELAGKRVVPEGCSTAYTVSHVMLGNTIMVTLAGPNGHREGTALGLDDLPALYSQMVRSMVTGRPMTGFNVIDRTNVTASQASPKRVQSNSFGYARLGYSAIFGDHAYAGPAFGFGYRAELDSFGIDVSFVNFQVKMPSNNSSSYSSYNSYYYAPSNGSFAGSLLKLEGLHFINPTANTTTYLGAGLSYGGTTFGSNWHGSGLQGELTVGYELPRASTLRVFVQADAVLPFYTATGETFSSKSGYTTAHRYAPSFGVSVGLGRSRR